MTYIKKTFCTAMMLFAVCFSFFPQEGGAVSAPSEAASSFETNTDYFGTSLEAEGGGQTQNALPSSSLGIWLFVRMIFVLAVVIVLIYGVLWFIKNKTNAVKTDDEFLRRAAYINIAPGKSVEVITLIDRAYVIGVTEDGITLLGEIDGKSDDQTAQMINAMNLRADQTQETKKPLNFNDVMNLFLAKKGSIKNVFSQEEQKISDILNENQNKGEEGENV